MAPIIPLSHAAPCDDCGDLGLRIDRHGVWLYHGSPILRKEMVCLFASMLRRAEDGAYWLISADERGTIQVDDVPFVVVEMFSVGDGRDRRISFRTNVDEIVSLDVEHRLRLAPCRETGDLIPYVLIRDGLEAKLNRAVYYHLMELGDLETIATEELFGLWSNGTFFSLGRLEDTI